MGAGQGVEIVQSGGRGGGGRGGGRSNIESVLSPGMRIEYWYNEDYGWIEGELVKAERIAGEVVWWAVKFPVDGTTENLQAQHGHQGPGASSAPQGSRASSLASSRAVNKKNRKKNRKNLTPQTRETAEAGTREHGRHSAPRHPYFCLVVFCWCA